MARTDGVPHILARDPEVMTTILESLKAGATINAAARFAGVSPDTLRRWRTRGMELLVKHEHDGLDFEEASRGEQMLMTIALETERVMGGLEIGIIGTVVKAAKSEWRAAAWLAEHHPQMKGSFSNRSEVIQANITSASAEALETKRDVGQVLANLSDKLAALESGKSVDEVIEAEVIEEAG